MMTLRSKIIVSLIGMSLFSIVIGGVIERTVVKSRFDQVIEDETFHGFVAEATAYYRTYGSWEAATAAEPFPLFGERFRPSNVSVLRTSDYSLPPQGPPPEGAPLPPGIAAGPPPDSGPDGRGPGAIAGGAPDYRLADLDGKIWIPGRGMPMGEIIPKEDLDGAIKIYDGSELIGYAFTANRTVMSDLENEYLQTMTESMWISILIIGVLSIPVAIFVGLRLSSPIKKLHHAVVAMQPGAVHQEVQVVSDDELGELTKSFNVMSSEMASFVQIIEEQKTKIVETEALRKEGMASISHELRTPLNNCVAQANAMLDGVRPMDGEQMGLLSGALDHLTKLVDDLFQLALADVNALECAKDMVDLSALAEEAVKARHADFEQKGSDVSKNIPEQITVMGDGKRLRQIIDNLLENCFRYANQTGKVEVSLAQKAGYAELSVSDDGPGVSAEVLGSIFDRFYRGDSSRNKTIGGTGLGLSLVKVWAEAQGGAVDAALSTEGGLVVRVLVPIAGSSKMRSVA